MASNSDDLSSENVSSNCQKRKRTLRKVPGNKKIKNIELNSFTDRDSDEGVLVPEVMVKVEVCELDGHNSPTQYEEKTIPQQEPPERIKKKTKKNTIKSSESPGPSQSNEYSCDKCGRHYPTVTSLQRHLVISHQDEDTKCPICKVIFKTKTYLRRHLLKVGDGVKCDQCDARFHTQAQLSKHKGQHLLEQTILQDRPPHTPLNVTRILSREELSEAIQNAIVSKMHKGRSVSDICQLYAVTPDIVNEIWNDREKYVLPKKVGKRSVRYMNSILEPMVYEWYNDQKDKGIQITGKMIQHVVENMARENGLVHFNAGNKWLEQFKKRYNIYLSKGKRDYSNVPQESVWKTKFFKEQWSDLRVKYNDDEVYTADEVGLFYNASKNRERKLGGKKYIHGDVTDRFSILLCANISGTDKRKLVVCGAEDPLRRSCRSPATLPVEYHRHAQCHFTTNLFEDYIVQWNEVLRRTFKKAVLILDRASIHSKLELSNLKLIFVPWKATSGLMPMKNGIYSRFRSEFRDLLLEFKVANVFRGIDRNLTCLEGLEMLEKAWENTPGVVITKSFIDIGYEVQTKLAQDVIVTKSDKNAEFLCNILKDYDVKEYFTEVNTLDLYLTVDEDALTGQGTNPSVFGGNHKATEPVPKVSEDLPLNTEKPASDTNEIFLRKTRALTDLEIIRKYLQTNDTTYKDYCNFLDVEKAVMDNFVKMSY